nr:hypothetical protein [Streptomyces noursei]
MRNSSDRPRVGDEVEYATGRRAIVTDIRDGIPYLRAAGGRLWPTDAPATLKVMRTREQRLADGDVW